MTILLLVTTFGVTLEICYNFTNFKMALIGESLITIAFGIDIVINFNRVILLKREKTLLTRRSDIACHYIKSWFLLDLISFFPFFVFSHKFKIDKMEYHLNNFTPSNQSIFIDFLRLLKILKTFKNLLKSDSFIKKNISRFKGKQKNTMSKVVLHLIMIIIFCHLFACVFYALPLKFSPDKNWIIFREIENKPFTQQYLSSIHWILQTIITVGYGDNNIT